MYVGCCCSLSFNKSGNVRIQGKLTRHTGLNTFLPVSFLRFLDLELSCSVALGAGAAGGGAVSDVTGAMLLPDVGSVEGEGGGTRSAAASCEEAAGVRSSSCRSAEAGGAGRGVEEPCRTRLKAAKESRNEVTVPSPEALALDAGRFSPRLGVAAALASISVASTIRRSAHATGPTWRMRMQGGS